MGPEASKRGVKVRYAIFLFMGLGQVTDSGGSVSLPVLGGSGTTYSQGCQEDEIR